MANNRFKERNMSVPIENHKTAAWANIEKMKRVSRVSIPNIIEVEHAKEHVERNQK